jgi:hypothetical protein
MNDFESGRSYERSSILDRLKRANKQITRGNDSFSNGWKRGIEDACQVVLNCKRELWKIEKLGEGPFDLLKSPYDEAFRKINEIIDRLNEMLT